MIKYATVQRSGRSANRIAWRTQAISKKAIGNWSRIAAAGCLHTMRNGIVSLTSKHSVSETVERLKEALRDKGIALFAVIDHSGEAEAVGITMRDTKLLIFGSPRAGTPVMLVAPTSAIDLPLKALVWEDAQRQVYLSYNDLSYIAERHAIPANLLANLAGIKILAAHACE
jgi:uncharacterized protein (DUF302 family)